ncbi:hypothetical protein NPS53_08110 [Pseudomonas putida]|uniref:hypothetical protein n=1 Tax=Pseudomonas putida TaxID=303 RepID=UPI0023631C66|nr:hypothetical protein [Pseudomonas putida]MDD2139534.1 hypothetical protein [Pseudomonas putida]HDS1721457.1 hypothetical protein [Pseudomonas putida]
MQQSLLTGEDRQWLSSQNEAVRGSMDFMVSDLLFPGHARTMRCAHQVLIWFKGSYIKATDLLTKIEQSAHYSQIEEVWLRNVYDEVQSVCIELSALDKKALIMVAGFEIITEAEIHHIADVAVDEARRELYGIDNDVPF